MNSLVGLKVDLIGSRRRCHSNVAVIRPSSEPPHLELRCIVCNTRIGRISVTTGAWLLAVVKRFGRLTEPIRISQTIGGATTDPNSHLNSNLTHNMRTKGTPIMRVSSLFGTYLKSADAKDAPIVGTISHVAVEMVGQGAAQEKKAVLHFEADDPKPLVLNRTNATTLEQAFGSETDAWSGHRVKIRCVATAFGGKPVDGLRVEALATKAAAKVNANADEIF